MVGDRGDRRRWWRRRRKGGRKGGQQQQQQQQQQEELTDRQVGDRLGHDDQPNQRC